MASTMQTVQLVLINRRRGCSSTIVIRGWLRGLLSLCLLGAPVVFGCMGYQLSLSAAPESSLHSQHSIETAETRNVAGSGADSDAPRRAQPAPQEKSVFSGRYAGAIPALMASAAVVLARPVSAPFIAYEHGRIIDPAAYGQRTHH